MKAANDNYDSEEKFLLEKAYEIIMKTQGHHLGGCGLFDCHVCDNENKGNMRR